MKRVRELLRRAVVPALALVTAFLVGAVVIVITDFEHLRTLGTDPGGALGAAIGILLEGYGAMFAGAIGDPGRILTALQTGNPDDIADAIRPISETLLSATPFIFVGLGLAVTFRAGLINLGVDGQFFIGGVGTLLTAGILAGLPAFVLLPLALAGGTLAGAAYGLVAGILKARTGAHEVITTLMLNPLAGPAAFLLGSLITISDVPAPLPRISPLIDLPTIRVDWGFVAALAMAVVISFFLFRTTAGLELRATGLGATAARSAGMRPGRSVMLAMAISGGMAGLSSAFMVLGPVGGIGFVWDLGYLSVALALLGGRRPGGVILVTLLYAALNNGAKSMVVVAGIPLALLTFIIAIAVMFVAAPGLIRSIWRLGPARPNDDPATVRVGVADST